MKINYPTWKIRGGPTPNETRHLRRMRQRQIDRARQAPHICHNRHEHAGKKNRRMREATPAEYAAGKAAMKEIIG